jgi:hypothetical protein
MIFEDIASYRVTSDLWVRPHWCGSDSSAAALVQRLPAVANDSVTAVITPTIRAPSALRHPAVARVTSAMTAVAARMVANSRACAPCRRE